METLLKAIVTGFGLALGAAIFKKHLQKRLGLEEDDDKKKDTTEETLQDGGAELSTQGV
jgi:hypothetical protein